MVEDCFHHAILWSLRLHTRSPHFYARTMGTQANTKRFFAEARQRTPSCLDTAQASYEASMTQEVCTLIIDLYFRLKNFIRSSVSENPGRLNMQHATCVLCYNNPALLTILTLAS